MIALRLFIAVLCCGCFASCAYRLGPTSTLNIRTIAVPNFVNHTYEPRMTVQATDAIIKRLQTDGSFRVVKEENADATLTGEVVTWRRHALRVSRDNPTSPTEYRLVVVATARLTDNRTGKKLMEGGFTGMTSYFFGDDMAQAERQAMPLALDDLARRIADRIIDAW